MFNFGFFHYADMISAVKVSRKKCMNRDTLKLSSMLSINQRRILHFFINWASTLDAHIFEDQRTKLLNDYISPTK